MIISKSHNQYVLFPNPFDEHLDSENRWVKFSKILPWNKLAAFYYKHMDSGMGAGTLEARIILGAVIIKHHENLSDEGTIEAIQENLYMQYFLGLPTFKKEKVFAPSLFVEIRKRLGTNYWQEINTLIIEHNTKKKDEDLDENNPKENEGIVNIDASVFEQDITYPTDLKILNDSREKLEGIISTICLKTNQPLPRMYKRVARKDFLNVSKKKKCTYKQVRKGNGKQLSYVCRNLKHIDTLLKNHTDLTTILNKHQLKYLQVINTVYEQQYYMYKNKIHKTEDRIVSIHQPHVRPIVRGKAGKAVEFGSKIGITIHNGLTYLDNLDWNNYNEADDLKTSVENYKTRNGYYPKKINADQKYMTRANRDWCKEKNIHLSGKPLGRPNEKTKEQIKEIKKSASERNCVEGKFGQAKRFYINDAITARLRETSESMIGAVVVVLNLIRLVQQRTLAFCNFLCNMFLDVILQSFYKFGSIGLFE
jgi:hypothetical protein